MTENSSEHNPCNVEVCINAKDTESNTANDTQPMHIRITCPCDLYPLVPLFYIAKLGFTGVYIFSSPEPKAHGELIVYQSSRRPSVRPCVRLLTLSNMIISTTSRPIPTKLYLNHHWVGERLHYVLGQIGLELWFPWQRIAPIGL